MNNFLPQLPGEKKQTNKQADEQTKSHASAIISFTCSLVFCVCLVAERLTRRACVQVQSGSNLRPDPATPDGYTPSPPPSHPLLCLHSPPLPLRLRGFGGAIG